MAKTPQIDLDIPLPNGGRHRGAIAEALHALAASPVGASAFFDNPNRHSISAHAAHHLGRGCYATRKENGGVRVWKTAERA